jgi:AcrR family transcriptional regulator
MKATAKPESQRQSAEERRDAVLDAAVIEFAAFGLHGASTEAIAERVGISQPYIFRLFGTKRDLFREAIERVVERILATFREAVAAKPELPLQAMGESFKVLLNQRDELTLLLHAFAAAHDPEIMLFARRRFSEIYQYVAQVSGASPAELRLFFAHGMLMMTACALDLPSIADEYDWVAELLKPPIEHLSH